MMQTDYRNAERYILNRLKAELLSTLYYHGFHHTEDVMQSAMEIATAENVTENNLNRLRIAVAFHDAGFLFVYKDHEEKGCEMCKEVLPSFHFSDTDIESVCGMIMATKIPQQPKNLLEQIIADADLDYLGRDDVYPIAQTLFDELKIHANLKDENKWNEIQINFLKSHRYFTDYSKKLRAPGKEKYLNELIRKI